MARLGYYDNYLVDNASCVVGQGDIAGAERIDEKRRDRKRAQTGRCVRVRILAHRKKMPTLVRASSLSSLSIRLFSSSLKPLPGLPGA